MSWRDELNGLIRLESMPASKMKSLAHSVVSNINKNQNYIDYYFKSIDDILSNCKPEQILNCLYIIDAILRELSHSQNHSILNKITKLFNEALLSNEKKIVGTIPENVIPKFIKLMEIWIKKEFFSIDLLRKWINKLKLEMETESIPITIDPKVKNYDSSNNNSSKRKLELIEESMEILTKMEDNDDEYDDEDLLNYHGRSSVIDSGSTTNTTSNSIFRIGMLSGGNEVLKKLKSNHSTSIINDDIMRLDVKMLSINTSILDLPNEILSKIFSYLNVLDLMRVNFVSRFFSSFVINCTFWRELTFNNIKNISNFHVYKIIQSYGNQIVKLDFSFCNYIDRYSIDLIVQHCHILQSLSLAKCQLGDDDLSKIIRYQSNLKSLNISQSSYSGKLVPKLFKFKGLKKLNIACSHGLLKGLYLKPDIQMSESLESLNIDCYCSTFVGPVEATAIQHIITNNSTLRKIKLHHMSFFENIPPNLIIRTTNLWKFVKFNDFASTKELLSTITRKRLNKRYQNGSTSIFLASEEGKVEQLKLLIKYEADHTISNYYGLTPMLVSKNIQTAKIWIENQVQPSNKLERDFLSVIPVLEKYYKYLKPNISDHPSIDEVKDEEMELLLLVISTIQTKSEVLELSKILTASFLKIPHLLKRIIESSKNARKQLIYSTIGNDDFFCYHIQHRLKKSQTQSILLDLLIY